MLANLTGSVNGPSRSPLRFQPRTPTLYDNRNQLEDDDESEGAGASDTTCSSPNHNALADTVAGADDVSPPTETETADSPNEDDVDQGDVNTSGTSHRCASSDAPQVTSDLRSDDSRSRKGTFIPDWAQAITSDFGERVALGKIDYWLGLGKDRKIRAKGRYLQVDEHKHAWYVVTSQEFGKQISANNKRTWRILDRLAKDGYVVMESITRRGLSMLRLRLNWRKIEADYVVAEGNHGE